MKTIKTFLSILFCVGVSFLFLSSCGKYEAPDLDEYYNANNSNDDDDEEEEENDDGYTGYIECTLCDGSGICDLCHGDGISAWGDECDYCDGAGLCHQCDGTGRIYY